MLIKPRELKVVQCAMLAVLLVFTIMGVAVLPFLQWLSYALWGLCCLFFLVMLFLYLRRPTMTRFTAWLAVYVTLLLVITVINANDVNSLKYFIVEVGLLMMIFKYYEENITTTVKACAIIFSGIIYFNLFYLIAFPEWILTAKDTFRGYLLGGNYNQMGGRIICGLITNVLCLKFSRKWLFNIIPLFIVSITTLFIVGSTTSLVGAVMFTIVCLIPTLGLKKAAMVGIFVCWLLFQFFVVFAGEGLYNNEFASYFIQQVLGKSMTFTFRTTMWEASGNLFAESPIWGFGIADEEWYRSNLSNVAIGPHNYIYYELLNGGLILLTVVIIMVATPVMNVIRYGLDNHSACLLLGIEVWFVMSLMEAYLTFCLIYMLTLVHYYPRLDKAVLGAEKDGAVGRGHKPTG